jgi:uroporphyrinogen-III synthase
VKIRPHLLLTRPAEDSASFAAQLEAAGFQITQAPCLEIVPFSAESLSHRPDAVILTSRHAVASLHAYGIACDTPVFAVGESTTAALRHAGYLHVITGADDALSLLPLIRASLPPSASLLYLRGKDIRHDLAGLVCMEGYPCEQRVVYAAHPVESLSVEARDSLKQGDLDGIVFFSARTIHVFARLATQAGLPESCWQRLRAVTLSAAMAKEAEAVGFVAPIIQPLHRGAGAIKVLKTLFS